MRDPIDDDDIDRAYRMAVDTTADVGHSHELHRLSSEISSNKVSSNREESSGGRRSKADNPSFCS